MTITIDGKEVTGLEKEALSAAFRKLLSEAVHAAILDGLADLHRQLRIDDDVERKLLAAAEVRPASAAGPEPEPDFPFTWAIDLVRPGKADQGPETREVTVNGMTVRLTRTVTEVEQPVAVATLTYATAGRTVRWQQVLELAPDGEWRVTRPPKRIEPAEGKKP